MYKRSKQELEQKYKVVDEVVPLEEEVRFVHENVNNSVEYVLDGSKSLVNRWIGFEQQSVGYLKSVHHRDESLGNSKYVVGSMLAGSILGKYQGVRFVYPLAFAALATAIFYPQTVYNVYNKSILSLKVDATQPAEK
ncbi:hypothetical protein MP228_007972 [Amoeboaphelidium protococcarum]|nr:hypothetical protein MP228_007972 [Amoeboaphelidium protococcarum]